ncbi:MAG: MBL fold metallo-hydrolase [Candidatus Promineifilaceae bacterium]|nr:MBL fold metallo-hydrolase [Candidatus Promineifilaceae bacterium]
MTANEAQLELRGRAVGPWPMNTYTLICPSSGESVLIDPGAEPDTLEDMLAGSQPVAILLTHTHPDHVGALAEMRQRLQVPLVAHPGPHFNGFVLDADRHVTTGDTIIVGNHQLHVYHTPGHIPDQISFLLDDDYRAIVGDTLFEGGPGKTWSADDFATTCQTLRHVVLRWPDDTVCYPGHGDYFRLGDKRAEIEAFLAKDHGEFYGDATWDM